VTVDPHVAAAVHEHLVDVGIGKQSLEPVEASETGDRGGDQVLASAAVGQRRHRAHVVPDNFVDVAGNVGDTTAERIDQFVVDRLGSVSKIDVGAHAAPRSSCRITRGSRATSRPASTARATAGSIDTVASTGAPTAVSTSTGRSARPGSATSSTPLGRMLDATARRRAR
jgi:hypothetical protein